MDETGHQIAVFGRIGSRPFNRQEMARLYLDDSGNPWYVDDRVDGPRGVISAPAPYKPNQTWERQFGRSEQAKPHGDGHGHGGAHGASPTPSASALPVIVPNGEARPLPTAHGGKR